MGFKSVVKKVLKFVKDVNISYSKKTGDVNINVSGEDGQIKFTREGAGDKKVAISIVENETSEG